MSRQIFYDPERKRWKRLRRLRKNDMVTGAFQKRIKLMLPYG